jgi:hypothetical protein
METDIRFIANAGECFCHLPEGCFIPCQNDLYFFAGEIYLTGNNPFIHPVEVFEKVQAGAAVHLWQVEIDMHLLLVPETDQLQLYLFIIKKGKLILPDVYTLGDAGGIVQVVIFTQTALVKDLVHHPAAFTAKMLFFRTDAVIGTGFTAVIAQ